MEKNSTPDRLSSGRLNPKNLLGRLGSIGRSDMIIFDDSEEPEDIEALVIDTAHYETVPESPSRRVAMDAISARAFEASGLLPPEPDFEPELYF